ncbi:MAG TPA: ABC transporter substrate-binding protein [Stellaceae bacterium]|nr:ABC transporter substrate-binding protein [Stellaceae bacterium]
MPLRPFAARLAGILVAGLVATPAFAGEFTDAAGRRLMLPDHIDRAMAADMSAEVLVFVLAPDKLVGWAQTPSGALPPHAKHVPLIGPIADPGATATITRLKPDVIIDVGEVTPDRAAFADQVTQATGTPYILLDGSFDRMATMLRVAGRLLGVADRGDDLAGSAEHAINSLRGQLLIDSAVNRPRVYYGLGTNGLEPALPGSPAAAAIEDAGAINVAALPSAAGPVAVTRQQIQEWNPDIIIAESPAFYNSLLHDPGWRTLAAVRDKHVYLEPQAPFGWIDDPPGVNRLIGLYWLSVLLYPSANQSDVRSLAQDFYDKFYGITLTDKQIDAIAKTAGIPASDTPHLADLPLGGTGIAPGNAPPGRGGMTLPQMPTTTPSYLMPK